MKMAKLTFLASFVLVLAPGLGAQDVEAREKHLIPPIKSDANGLEAGMNKGPREKQVADLHKKRRDLRDQLGKALQKDDRKKAKKAEAKLQSVERQLSQLERIERGKIPTQVWEGGGGFSMRQAIGNAPDDPTWFWKRKCKGCGTRHGGIQCPTFGTNPGRQGDVLKPIDCNCHGKGCGYCDVIPDSPKAVRNRPDGPPVLLTRPQQGRSELAPGSGGEFDGKKRRRCLTCGKKHKINGGKCTSVGDDLPNSSNVRPADLIGRPKGPKSSSRPIPVRRPKSSSRPVPVRRPKSSSRPVPVRRPKSSSRPVPVRRPETSSRPSPSRRPATRASQVLKPVRKPR